MGCCFNIGELYGNSCYGGGVGCCYTGYCSECVGVAGCNPELCGSCITGSCWTPTECLTPGSDTGICGNPCITPCLIPNCQIPCCAVNQVGPTCCCGYQPCSPTQCGTTDQPPCGFICHGCAGRSGGSGAGSAGSAGGGKSGAGGGAGSQCASKLSQAMNKLGATIAGLLSGGKKTSAKAVIPGQPAIKPSATVSLNTMLLVILIVGALLLMLAFGHKPEGD